MTLLSGNGIGGNIAGDAPQGGASGMAGKGWHSVILELDGAGEYSLVCAPPGAPTTPLVHRLSVGAPAWRAMSPAPPGASPPPRFKPAAAAAGDAFVVFGGAAADQGYLGDAWVLPAAAPASTAGSSNSSFFGLTSAPLSEFRRKSQGHNGSC